MKQKGITTGTYTEKKPKKNSNLPMCPTCKKCKDRSICKNRRNLKNCEICKQCTDKDNCDKFYHYIRAKALLTIGKNIETGEPIRKSFTADTEDEALELLYKYKIEMKENGSDFDDSLKKTIKSIADIGHELEDSKYRKGKTKGNAYITNIATLNRIKANKFANIPINQVKKNQIERFLEDERSKSNSVIKKDVSMLKKIFETAFDNKYISTSLFQSINTIEKPRSIKEDKDVKALSYNEQIKLVEYLETNNVKHKNIILICLYTGMRIGEVLALNYKEDIDLDSMQITVLQVLMGHANIQTTIDEYGDIFKYLEISNHKKYVDYLKNGRI